MTYHASRATAGSNPPVVAPGDLPAALTARYALGDALGAGGMGCVYRAEERATGRVVAVKLLTRLADAGARERFVREGKLLASIQHPSVLAVHEAGIAEGLAYLVIEYAEGGSLEALLRRGLLLPDRAVEIAEQFLAGLQACHEQGIVHRDLKPANVLLTGTGVVKLADFGVAKSYGAAGGYEAVSAAHPTVSPDELGTLTEGAAEHPGATALGALIGTPLYMSPEQARGEPVVVASDIYAAGTLLYEMIAGRVPFLARDVRELLRCIREDRPVPLTHLVPGLDVKLSAIVMRSLAKDLASRPPSAETFATALRQCRSRGPLLPAGRNAERGVPSVVITELPDTGESDTGELVSAVFWEAWANPESFTLNWPEDRRIEETGPLFMLRAASWVVLGGSAVLLLITAITLWQLKRGASDWAIGLAILCFLLSFAGVVLGTVLQNMYFRAGEHRAAIAPARPPPLPEPPPSD